MTTSVITVQINDDRYYESNSLNFTLTITSDELNNNIVIGETGQTTVTIIDDECKLSRLMVVSCEAKKKQQYVTNE